MTITLRKIEEEFRKLDEREAFMREYYAPGKPIRHSQQPVSSATSKGSLLDAAEGNVADRAGSKQRRAASAHPSSNAGTASKSAPPRIFSAGPTITAYGQPAEENADKTKRPAGVPARQRPVSSPGKFATRLRQTIFDPVGEAAAAATSPRTLVRSSSNAARPGEEQPAPPPPPPVPPPEPTIPARFRKQKHWFAYCLEEGDKVSIYGLNLGQQLKQGLTPGGAVAGSHPSLDASQHAGLDDWRYAASDQAWASIPNDASGLPGYMGRVSRPLSGFHPTAAHAGMGHAGGSGGLYSATDAYQRSLLTETGRMGRSLHLLREELGHTNLTDEPPSPTSQQRGGGGHGARSPARDGGETSPAPREPRPDKKSRKGKQGRSNRPATASDSPSRRRLSQSLPSGRAASARRATSGDTLSSAERLRESQLSSTMAVDRRGSRLSEGAVDGQRKSGAAAHLRSPSSSHLHPAGADQVLSATSGNPSPAQHPSAGHLNSFRIVSATARPLSAALGPMWASSASIKDRAGGGGRDGHAGAANGKSRSNSVISESLLPARRYEGEAMDHSGGGGGPGVGVGPAEAWQVPRGSFKKGKGAEERAMVFVRKVDGSVAALGDEYPIGVLAPAPSVATCSANAAPSADVSVNASGRLYSNASAWVADTAGGQPQIAGDTELLPHQGHARERPQERFVVPPASFLNHRPSESMVGPGSGGGVGAGAGMGRGSGLGSGWGRGWGTGTGVGAGAASLGQREAKGSSQSARLSMSQVDAGPRDRRQWQEPTRHESRPGSRGNGGWMGSSSQSRAPVVDGNQRGLPSPAPWQGEGEGENTPRLAGSPSRGASGGGKGAADESGAVGSGGAGLDGGGSGTRADVDNYDNPDCEEYYFLNIGVHQDRVLSHWRFNVFVTDKATGNRVQVAESAKVNRDNSIIFQDPDETTLSPARLLPWVRRPRDLLGRSLLVEATSVVPRVERVVEVAVFYGEHSAVEIVDQLNRPKSPTRQPQQLQLYGGAPPASSPLSPKTPGPASPPLQAFRNPQFSTTLLVAGDAQADAPASPRGGPRPRSAIGYGSGKPEEGAGPTMGTVVSPRHHASRQSLLSGVTGSSTAGNPEIVAGKDVSPTAPTLTGEPRTAPENSSGRPESAMGGPRGSQVSPPRGTSSARDVSPPTRSSLGGRSQSPSLGVHGSGIRSPPDEASPGKGESSIERQKRQLEEMRQKMSSMMSMRQKSLQA